MSRYRHDVPLDLRAPLPKETPSPLRAERPKACNCGDMDCLNCWNAGVRYADYLQQKRLENL